MKRAYEGRLSCGSIENDASRWAVTTIWNEAKSSWPVYGYLVLIADDQGYVNVLDLRFQDQADIENTSDEERFARTKEAMKRNKAKWWAYMPWAPPRNIEPIGWKFDNNHPLPFEANDPPKEQWERYYNLPIDIVK